MAENSKIKQIKIGSTTYDIEPEAQAQGTAVTVVTGVNGGGFSKTTRYLHPTTANAAPNSHTHTVTVSGTTGENSGDAITAITGYPNFSGGSLGGTKTFVTSVSGGSGSLESYDAATGGTKKVSNGTRVPYVAAQGTITGASYTPAGSVSLTAGTAPSLGAATTKYLSASFSGTAATITPTLGGTKTFVTGYPDFSGGSLTGTKTFVTGVSGGSGDLTSNTTETGGIKYLEAVSFENGTLALATKYLHHTHTGASASGTGTVGFTAASLGTASTGTVSITGASYTPAGSITLTANDATATGRITYVQAQGTFSAGTTPKASASFSGTAATITPTLSAATTYYLAHAHTAASSGGSGTVTLTAASLGTPNTGSAAPAAHTHSYGSSTALTTSSNNGTAVAAITSIAANTSKATGDLTYLEDASHTNASASGTASVIKAE